LSRTAIKILILMFFGLFQRDFAAAFCTLPPSAVAPAEFASRCLQVFWSALYLAVESGEVTLIADAGQFGQDLILNAVSEINVGFFLAQVLERQYSDRFSGVLALGPELV
jgi:hypothetical protein